MNAADLTVQASLSEEQIGRVFAQGVLRILVEQYSVDQIHQWLQQEALFVREAMPCGQQQEAEGR